MIHPYSCNVISVCNKLSLSSADDGGVCPVHPHASEIVQKHLPYALRVHQKQSKTVLPEIPPSSSPFSVIVVGKEGAAIYSPQNGLKAHPAHKIVKFLIARMVSDIDLFLPVGFRFCKCCLHLVCRPVRVYDSRYLLRGLRRSQKNRKGSAFSRLQQSISKLQTAHSLFSFYPLPRRDARIICPDSPRSGVTAALPDKFLRCREEGFRVFTLSRHATDKITDLIPLMPPLIKGESRCHRDSFLNHTDTMQQ